MKKTFADVHNFSLMIGQTVEFDSAETLEAQSTDVPSNEQSQRWLSPRQARNRLWLVLLRSIRSYRIWEG